MIYICPFCGSSLPKRLNDGIAACTHCGRIFDSSTFNRLLSAAWILKKNPSLSLERIQFQSQLSESEAIFVYTYITEYGYSHDDFIKVMKKLGINQRIYVDCPA